VKWTEYARFLLVGGVVGAITLVTREGVGWLLGADDRVNYSISILVAYSVGIALSFLMNSWFTFRSPARGSGTRFLAFVPVALLGMALTWLFALGLRQMGAGWGLGGREWATPAFGIAALLASALTYPLNSLLVFGPGAERSQRNS
jgi:putative flippase GtrA